VFYVLYLIGCVLVSDFCVACFILQYSAIFVRINVINLILVTTFAKMVVLWLSQVLGICLSVLSVHCATSAGL